MTQRVCEIKTFTKVGITLALCLSLLPNAPTAICQAPSQDAAQSSGLIIAILDGEGALNDIRQRTAREPIVEVEDRNHKPVAGAAVLFSLPSSGPGGAFAGGSQTLSTVTDSAGRAVAHGLQPNSLSGSYSIHVRVSINGLTSETDIHQENRSGQSSNEDQPSRVKPARATKHAIPAKVIVIVAVVVAAGTIAGILATDGGSSTSISAGPPTVTNPTAVSGIRIPLRFHSH